VLRLRLELWRQKNWLLHHNNEPSHTSFSTGNFRRKENGSRHFDTNEVMEAESQAVVNSLKEHEIQDAF
jgi:hypothetical protein